MAIFDDLEKPETTSVVVDLDKLKASLTDNQLKVARQNYRTIVSDMAIHMDINCKELKELISRGVIERLLMYKM